MLTVFGSGEELTPEAALTAPVRYPRPSRLAEPVILKGQAAKALAALGIATTGDLIEHLPHSHRDRRDVRLAAELGVGEEATVAVSVRGVSVRPMRDRRRRRSRPSHRDRRDVRLAADLGIGEEATVAVSVRGVSVRPMRDRRRRRVEARVFDQSGPLVAVWFNQPWIARQLGEGAQVLLHGKLRRSGEFWVSEHELFGNGDAPVHTIGLVPVHPATEGISAARLRSLVWDAYQRMFDTVEPLPAGLRAAEGLPDRAAALAATHFPDRPEDEAPARRRLAFEELLLLQLAVAGRRRARREERRARPLAARGVAVDRWRWSLPFELTGDQVRAMAEIDADLARDRPMQRLLMGEVGAGKTVVALCAMLRAVENGGQAALMAPTETLAEQHHRTLDSAAGRPARRRAPHGLDAGRAPP